MLNKAAKSFIFLSVYIFKLYKWLYHKYYFFTQHHGFEQSSL